jgi:hypothetical protein
VDVPRTTIVHPSSWLHQQLPSAVVERRKKEAAKTIERALPKATTKSARKDEPECEHDTGVVGRWVKRNGETAGPIVLCRKCGRIVE